VTRCDVLIIGAGVAGLACAIGVPDAGLRVIVVEKLGAPCSSQMLNLIRCNHVLTADALTLELSRPRRVLWHRGD
jgi:flavin-dependent dehydrogenase